MVGNINKSTSNSSGGGEVNIFDLDVYINSTSASGNYYTYSLNVGSADMTKLLNCNHVTFVPYLIGDSIINVGYSSELDIAVVKSATYPVEIRGSIYWLGGYMENTWFFVINTNGTGTFTLYVNSDIHTDKIHSLYKVKVNKID